MPHTPGPWLAGWSGDPDSEGHDAAGPLNIIAVGQGGVAVCEPIPSGHANTWDIVQANARLIAAAPDLLAAAQLAILNFKRQCAADSFLGDDDYEAWGALDAAIAKAEGR